MGVNTEKYIRKPLIVDAVRVTAANFDELAAWCQGEVDTEETPGGKTKKFVRVRVHNPKNPRQTKAFVGDWLLYTERGYKVYTNKAFRAAFDPVTAENAQLSHPKTPNPPRGVGAQITGSEALDTLSAEKDDLSIDLSGVKAVDPIDVPGEETVDEQAQVSTPPTGVEPAAADPVPEQPPEVAASGKRVLSQEEQIQMGPDEVREAVSSGDAVLAQDLG